MKRIVLIVLFALLAIGMPITIQVIYSSDKDLRENGIDVDATVISVDNDGGSADIKVEYTDDDGNTVTAKGVTYDSECEVGGTFRGKYMPGEPDKVIMPMKNSFKWTICGVMLLMTIIGILGEYKLLRSQFMRSSVGAHGITARAQVVSYDPGKRVCTINFQRADGVDCNVTLSCNVAYAAGGYVNIRYVPKGKSARVVILGY